jgi:hypothetical protein
VAHFAFSIGELDRCFIAGFLEGEACFVVSELNGGQSFSCGVSVRMRDDEQDLLEWLVGMTGFGRLYRVPAQPSSRPQIAWHIGTQDDCRELLGLIRELAVSPPVSRPSCNRGLHKRARVRRRLVRPLAAPPPILGASAR